MCNNFSHIQFIYSYMHSDDRILYSFFIISTSVYNFSKRLGYIKTNKKFSIFIVHHFQGNFFFTNKKSGEKIFILRKSFCLKDNFNAIAVLLFTWFHTRINPVQHMSSFHLEIASTGVFENGKKNIGVASL